MTKDHDPLVAALRELIRREPGGRRAVADTLDMSEQTIYQVESGIADSKTGKPKGVGPKMRSRLNEHYPGWLTLRVANIAADEDGGGFHHINQYDTGGAMGGGLVLRDQPGVIKSWNVSQEWIQKNVRSFSAAKNLCIVTGFGDSMKPMFNPGDPLLVDTGVVLVEFDSVYFFRVGEEGFVKRLQRVPGVGIRVLSANRDNYEPWTITKEMDFQVLGRVLKVWKSEDF